MNNRFPTEWGNEGLNEALRISVSLTAKHQSQTALKRYLNVLMKHTQTEPDIPIIFEDNHLLVIDKPHNLLSQADRTGDADALSLCRNYLKWKYNKSGDAYIGLVHRLDRPAGGLMLFAKTSKAAKRLSKQLRNRTIQKTYWAVVYGKPPENCFLTHYLLKNKDTNIVEAVTPGNPKAKKAVLSFQLLEPAGDLNLLSVHLQTGRPHQIRVQLSVEGYPIWGDYKYGIQQPDGRTMALKAVELVFDHPVSHEEMRFILPPPVTGPWTQFEAI